MIGLVVLIGIVVNNAIVLVDRINRKRDEGLALREAILEAGRARLRPILMTTTTTVLGLLPLTGWLASLPLLGALGSGEAANYSTCDRGVDPGPGLTARGRRGILVSRKVSTARGRRTRCHGLRWVWRWFAWSA